MYKELLRELWSIAHEVYLMTILESIAASREETNDKLVYLVGWDLILHCFAL